MTFGEDKQRKLVREEVADILARNREVYIKEQILSMDLLQQNRHRSCEPFDWFGPADEPCPPGKSCACSGCRARFSAAQWDIEKTKGKPVSAYSEFIDETNLVEWQRRAHQHRIEGCIECLEGRCITGALKDREEPPVGKRGRDL